MGPNTAVQYKLLNNVNYAAHGPVKGWSWGNSSTAAPNSYVRVFDLDGRIASYNLGNPLTTGTTRTLTYDAASRIKAYTHTSSGAGINAGALNQTFGYDDADQLASYSGNGTSQGFKYDPSGNRTQLTIGSATYTNSIAATSNRVASTTGPAAKKTNSYDLSGNLKSDATVTYTYSAQSRMSAAKNGATVSSYLYNGIGQRVRQIASTQTANPFGILVYDESGQIIGEYDTSTGKATREYIYLGATLVGVLEDVLTGTAPNQVHVTNLIYAYTDHLNTPRILARSSDNKIVWRWDNGDPFGVIPPNENPSAAGQFKLNLRMPGQYFDSTTNLFYNYFRDYDPQLGRYIQSDPIGLAGGINTYAYVGSLSH
ncbi:hypothetical protein LP419_31395 [Massilia sp. H-1]|nr:hypothetical protein LP419_31395 [Massilia sp. H-1]